MKSIYVVMSRWPDSTTPAPLFATKTLAEAEHMTNILTDGGRNIVKVYTIIEVPFIQTT